MPYVCGIDPGLSGGLTFISDADDQNIVSFPMPTILVGKKEKLYGEAIVRHLEGLKPKAVFIEQVGAMPGQGVTSMFSFGYGCGQLEGIVSALRIPLRFVRPQEWMKFVLAGLPKEGAKSSVLWCQRYYPSVDWRRTERCKTPHDGKTDSACIAYYGLKKG